MYCARCCEPIKAPLDGCSCGSYVYFQELDERQTLAVSYTEPSQWTASDGHQAMSRYVPNTPKPKPKDEKGQEREAPLKSLLYHEKYVSEDYRRFYSTGWCWLDDKVKLNPWWAEANRKDLTHRHELATEKLDLEKIPTPKYQLFLALGKESGALMEIGIVSSWEDVALVLKDVEDGAKSGQFAEEMDHIGQHPKHLAHLQLKRKGEN